ncbi:hypothetical protein [Flagellimonas aequoris]|uniref:Amidohydrolase-related domain-containing protein n=1 Tax=Flagellimonas aequoris TaxID=2306997 RepID=A0A418N888_9FLAO|nr:hypothetical protein [Allomuricauda aequoris]RIV71573.1 hypothetical protein D2U88_07355 [Allomuricauda aequoris]TXK03138.1 hypothetical protein FQ019_07300 [Allomuricauda aequoris]
MPTTTAGENYIFNAHTHLFTKDHVPRYLARKFLPAPFYKWFPTSLVLKVLYPFYHLPKDYYSYTKRNERWRKYKFKMLLQRNWLLKLLVWLPGFLVKVVFLYYFLHWIEPLLLDTWFGNRFYGFTGRNMDSWAFRFENRWNLFLFLLLLVLLFPQTWRMISRIGKALFVKVVGADRLEFFSRYINLVRYSEYSTQGRVFEKLKQQYPPESKFVVLPMDMEYMGAGKVEEPFLVQMEKLMGLKKNNPEQLYPFVHVDPRRIALQKDQSPFFLYDATDAKNLKLKNCKLKEYMDDGACGIKIYPALGYYPFAKELLPLWLFCAQQQIPVTTHCSVGPIFYRGAKKKEWDRHPIFQEIISGNQEEGNQVIEMLRLSQVKNKDFQSNFTHPLNYCCLLMPEFLKKVLDLYNDTDLNQLFGYANGELHRDLSKLKINLAHYGGAEHWERFLQKDRQLLANEVLNRPDLGLQLKSELHKEGNLYAFWHYTDWFSIITSMIVEFENVYADISYTAHDNKYLNVLSVIMDHKKVREKVLFGTDFYVVSNHKTEKAYWIDMQNLMHGDTWEILSCLNPQRFMQSGLLSFPRT